MFPFLVDITMTQTKKMQDGGDTPTLYNFYESQYDFNNLARRVDSGINAHISTLKKGKKYEKEFREAVANLMEGVKDGTITFGNGRYNDSLGRYRNDEDKNKDVYGWAASYIYDNMQNVPKYVKQNTSKKYDNTSLGRELVRTVFRSDSGNLQYFWDVDPLDTSTGTRGIEGRIGVLNEAINLMNADDALTDYSESDKAIMRKNLQQASQILQDGITPGESLKLSKIFGGIDWNNWLRTDFNEESNEKSNQQTSQQEQQFDKNKFYDYVHTKHPVYNGELSSQVLNPVYNNETQNFARRLGEKSNDYLQQIPLDKLADPDKYLYINALISRKLLPKSNNLYILPNTLKDETVLTYDLKTRTLSRKRTHELEYYRNKWRNEYNQQNGNYSDQLDQFFTEFKKNGGIIKAQDGTQLWYSALSAAGDYDPAKYQYSYDTSRLVNADMSDENWDPWISNVSGVGSGRYQPTSGNTREYTRSIEETPYYQQFRKDLLNPDGTFTKVGLEWAKQTDKLLPKGSTATFFDENGKLRKSWTVTNRDVYGRKPQTFDKLADYVNYVNYDQILGGRHNTFLNTGKRYFYKDQNGVEHWVDPNEISKYEVSANPVRSGWNDDNTVYWHDFQLTGLKPKSDKKKEKKTGSSVYPTGTQSKADEFAGSRFGDFMLGITPDLIGAGRLFASLRTNNRVARTLDRSLRPVLKDTYERYSPITGAFSEMQFRNRQAADLRRQASRPFTSDSSLQLAGQLEADRQARDLEYQGFLADDKEIKRTQEAALARQEDNMARRSEVSNFNRASINQTNREKAQLEATRLKRNWQSVDNYLQEVEGRLRTDLAERRAIRQNASMQTAQTRYQEFLQRFNEDYKRDHPNATQETMLNDPYYIQKVQDLRRRYQYDTYNIGLGRYYRDPYAGIYDKDNIPTYESILYSKNGGRLRPSIMTMINKVIKNESYT